MERDIDEILSSQTKMLARLEKETQKSEKTADISKAYQQQVRHAKTWITEKGISAMSVDYAQLVEDPELILPQIARFLDCENDLDNMRRCIDPTMYRERK